MSNSNYTITKVTVDPVSQEITNLEVNGKEINTGGNLEDLVDTISENGTYHYEPSEDRDGFLSADITVEVPTPDVLRSVLLTECDLEGEEVANPHHYKGIATMVVQKPESTMTTFWSFGSWDSGDEEPENDSGGLKSFVMHSLPGRIIYEIESSYYSLSYVGYIIGE